MTVATLERPTAARPPPSSPPARDYISWSAISTYRSCPLRYYFRYVAGLPDDHVSASLVFGAAIHRAIEHHFREQLAGNPPLVLADLVAAYRMGWDERAEPVHFGKESRETLDKLAERMLDTFRQHDLSKPPGKIIGIEEELRGSIIAGVPDLLARVDLIAETQDELVINDWKTSRSRWTEEQIEDAAEQLVLYSSLVSDLAPRKRLRIDFVVLTKTKEVAIDRHSLTVSDHQLDRTKRLVDRVWKSIGSGHFYPAPSLLGCSGCPFREPCRRWPG
jgi:putative RecB family exonuclease